MSTSERQTFLLGPNRLQLELMSQYISEHTRISCRTVCSLTAVPCSPDTRHLILYDCNEWKESRKSSAESDVLARHLATNFVVLINVDHAQGMENEALSQGIRGFLYQNDGSDILLKMVNTVFASELWVSRNVMTDYIQGSSRKATQRNNMPSLTTREIDVLTSISQGRSNCMIAEQLCISPHTVKTHIYRIFKKINVSSRLQAARWSSQHLSA